VLDIGARVRKFMSKKIKYTKGEIGKFRVVENFLPSPADLVLTPSVYQDNN
jgi:hypothetical protein